LEGAVDILECTVMLYIEVYAFKIQPHSHLFWELCAWLDAKGFAMVDFVDVLHRQADAAFWQADFIFLRKGHPVSKKLTWM